MVNITPFIICNNQKIYIEDLTKTNVKIEIYDKAQSIEFSVDSAEIAPDGEKEIAINVFSNKEYETIKLSINGTDLIFSGQLERDAITGEPQYGYIQFNDSLLNVRLKSVEDVPVVIANVKMYKHTYVFVLSMNIDIYRNRTASNGVNAIANGVEYTIEVVPETNSSLSSSFEFEITPTLAKKVDSYIYAGNKDSNKSINNDFRYHIGQFNTTDTVLKNS